MQSYTGLFKRRANLERNLYESTEAMSQKQAKTIIDEHFDIASDSLEAKLAMLKKIRKILPEKKC
jgi:hypothetical protein